MDLNKISSATEQSIFHLQNGKIHSKDEWIAKEAPLEIRLSGEVGTGSSIQYMITMRTPGNDVELVKGILFNEGIIEKNKDILRINRLDQNVLELKLSSDAHFDFKKYKHREVVTSSCGICGKSSLEAVSFQSKRLAWSSKVNIQSSLLSHLPERMRSKQTEFSRTGGVHAAGLFDLKGNLLTSREDIGRHNALDKLAGVIFEQDLSQAILLLSGRSSFELVQKTAMLGIPILASIGPASTMAIEVAALEGITLIGFLKKDRFNIYTGSERILE